MSGSSLLKTLGVVALATVFVFSLAACGGGGVSGSINGPGGKGVDPKTGGSGTKDDPFQLNTPQALKELADRVSSGDEPDGLYYKLTEDIDLSEYGASYNGGKGWKPIGNDNTAYPFTGHLDGNGKTISNLFIDSGLDNNVGLFGYIAGGSVKDLGIVDANITGGVYVGGVAGLIDNSNISDSYVTGDVSGDRFVGGVAGYVYDSSISDSYTTGNVSGSGNNVGGIAGRVIEGSINDSYATGDVSGVSGIGGVAGRIDNGSINDSYATGNVSANTQVGGVVGIVTNDGSIKNCYATGDVSGSSQAGGVAGQLEVNSSVSNSFASGNVNCDEWTGGVAGYVRNGSSISNSYATGDVTGVRYLGGVAGFVADSSVSDCYATGNVSGDGGGGVGGVVGRIDSGSVTGCAALNQAIVRKSGAATTFGRVLGLFVAGITASNNVAYDGIMLVEADMTTAIAGVTVTSDHTGAHGEDIDKAGATDNDSYTTSPLSWAFGGDDDNPWAWGPTTYPLPVLYWQSATPTLPAHLN